jgi:hypothetical protein
MMSRSKPIYERSMRNSQAGNIWDAVALYNAIKSSRR